MSSAWLSGQPLAQRSRYGLPSDLGLRDAETLGQSAERLAVAMIHPERQTSAAVDGKSEASSVHVACLPDTGTKPA